MNTRFPLCFFAMCTSLGCAKKKSSLRQDASVNVAGATALLLAGAQLGKTYFSALGEQCFEVYPSGGPSAQIQAMCMRKEGWTLLPPIYQALPQEIIHAAPLPRQAR